MLQVIRLGRIFRKPYDHEITSPTGHACAPVVLFIRILLESSNFVPLTNNAKFIDQYSSPITRQHRTRIAKSIHIGSIVDVTKAFYQV